MTEPAEPESEEPDEPDEPDEPYGFGFGDPIGWFRDEPARVFGVLGTVVFVLGWIGVLYVALIAGVFGGNGGPSDTSLRLQLLISLGSTVTLAAAALWVVAVLL